MTLYEAIFRRKSIRKFRQDEIDERTLEKIRRFGEDIMGIYPDIPVSWKMFRAGERRLKGLFLVKAPWYMVIYSQALEGYQENAGYLMEQMSLYMHTLGIGSCYQGAAMLGGKEKTELCPVMIMAFGRPAEPLERSREDFKRLELKKLMSVRGNFGKVQRKLLEPARLAPSAMNLQPWRFVVTDNRIHLFVKKPGKLGYTTQQNFNLFDAGISFAHMLITAEELWMDVEFQKLDSILEKDFQNFRYVGSIVILNESEKI